MKKLLIGLTLVLVVLGFFSVSKGSAENTSIISEVNRMVDEQLDRRLCSLTIGAEISALLNDTSK